MSNTISQYHKIILIYVGIIILTSIIFIYFKHKEEREKLREKFSFDDIGKVFNPNQNGVSDAFKQAGDALDPQNIIDNILKPLQPIIDFFKFVPSRLNHVKNSTEDITNGIRTGWNNLGTSIKQGGDDIIDFFPLIDKFLNRYLKLRLDCTFDKMNNFRKCYGYYMLDLIGGFIYFITVKLPVLIIGLIIGCDLMPYVNMGWDVIYCADDFIFSILNFHFAHWPNGVLDDCYLCTDLPPQPGFIDQMNKTHADFYSLYPDAKTLAKDPNHRTIPNLMNEPTANFEQAKVRFQAAIEPDYNDDYNRYVDNQIAQLTNTYGVSTQTSPNKYERVLESPATLNTDGYERHSLTENLAKLANQ